MVPIFMATAGIGMIAIWSKDIISAKSIDRSEGLLRAHEIGKEEILLPHWIAEYLTAIALIFAAIGYYRNAGWSRNLSLLSLGALTYTSINSLSWALAKKERLVYAIPMIVCLIGAMIAIVVLFRQ